MSKIAIMDKYLDSNGEKISSSLICEAVESIFHINLDKAPVLIEGEIQEGLSSTGGGLTSREAIDSCLNQFGENITGADIRGIINGIFGINLDGIVHLEGARISLYSKNQWIVHQEKDLFVVHTGTGDIDAKVYPTTYFMEQTGIEELPTDLQHSLIDLGYSYNEEIGSFYYTNPASKAVPDSFKGQTMAAIRKVIERSFSHF